MKPTETIFSKVAGTSFYSVPWSEMKAGDKLVLKREPENIYDNNAIAILTNSGQQIGHINRIIAADIASLIDDGNLSVQCEISNITGRENNKNRGCNIKLTLIYSDKYLNSF